MSMEIGACYCDFDGDPVNVCNIVDRRARIEHECDECFRVIKPREKYHYITFHSDGKWNSAKRCAQCYQIGLDYCCGVLDAGAVWAHVWEHLGVDLRTGKTRET